MANVVALMREPRWVGTVAEPYPNGVAAFERISRIVDGSPVFHGGGAGGEDVREVEEMFCRGWHAYCENHPADPAELLAWKAGWFEARQFHFERGGSGDGCEPLPLLHSLEWCISVRKGLVGPIFKRSNQLDKATQIFDKMWAIVEVETKIDDVDRIQQQTVDVMTGLSMLMGKTIAVLTDGDADMADKMFKRMSWMIENYALQNCEAIALEVKK